MMEKAGNKDFPTLRPAKVLLPEESTKKILDLIKKSKLARGEVVPDGKSKKSNSKKKKDDNEPLMNEKAIERQNRRLLRVLIRESIQNAVTEARQSSELEMKNQLNRAENNSVHSISNFNSLGTKDQNNHDDKNCEKQRNKKVNDHSIATPIRASEDSSKLSPKVRITFQNEKNKVKSKVCVFSREGTSLEDFIKEACTKLKITKNKEKKVAWLYMDDYSSKYNNHEKNSDSKCVRRVIIQKDIVYLQNDTTLILSLRPKEEVLKEFYDPDGKSATVENTRDQNAQEKEKGKNKKKKEILENCDAISSSQNNDNHDLDDVDLILSEEEAWKNQQDSMRKAYDENRERKAKRISSSTNTFPHDFSTKFLHEKLKNQSTKVVVNEKKVNLPAHRKRHTIVQAVQKSRVSIIKGAAGSGKTTQVPQFILDDCVDRLEDCFIMCCQPRRVAAIGVAERISYGACVVIKILFILVSSLYCRVCLLISIFFVFTQLHSK